MATAEEILAAMTAEAGEMLPEFVIDSDLRVIDTNDAKFIFGVEGDDDVNRVRFVMPRKYRGVDLSTFEIRINYRNANDEKGVYNVLDAVFDDNKIEFTWLVDRHTLAKKGNVEFVVCMRDIVNGKSVRELNTTIAGGIVLEGLEPDEGSENDGIGEELILQEKAVSPETTVQYVTPDDGYDGLSMVTVNAMSTAEQATPSIAVSSVGLITASAEQTTGYVTGGTKTATEQLDVMGARTITPGTSNQTIQPGWYIVGTQTIKGDENLLAENIKNGVSIFGVQGTLEASGIDTSDATAAANDIAIGKTAYVNGEKITGDVHTLDTFGGIAGLVPVTNGDKLQLQFESDSPYLFRSGFWLSTPLSSLGDATAADVANGKTFTSASGLKVVGTLGASGEAGVVGETASGTVTIAQDGTYETITHNLGFKPNFVAWMMQDAVTSGELTAAAVCGASFDKGSGTGNYHYMVDGFGSTGSAGGTAARSTNDTYMTTTTARISAHNSYKLIAGKTYRWICGVMADVL